MNSASLVSRSSKTSYDPHMRTHWTAEELRALGAELPDFVPGHATIPREKVRFFASKDADTDIGVVFLDAMTWAETRMKPLGEA